MISHSQIQGLGIGSLAAIRYGRAAAGTLRGLRVLPGGTGRELQGLYHAADDDAYQGPKAIPGLLHQSLGNEVSLSNKVAWLATYARPPVSSFRKSLPAVMM